MGLNFFKNNQSREIIRVLKVLEDAALKLSKYSLKKNHSKTLINICIENTCITN